MATRNIVFGSSSTDQEIDLIDVLALIFLPIAASLLFGIFTWEIQVFGGYDFTAALWTIAGADISLALLIVVGSFAWIVLTNLLNKRTEMGDYEYAVLVASLGLPIAYVFIPAVADMVMWHDATQLAALLAVSAGSIYASYAS